MSLLTSRCVQRDIVKREGDLVSVVLVDIDTGFEFCGSIPTDCVFECPDQLARIPRLAIHLVQAYIKPIDSNMSYWPSDVTLQVKKQIDQQIIKIEIESKDNRIDGIPCPSYRSIVSIYCSILYTEWTLLFRKFKFKVWIFGTGSVSSSGCSTSN